MEKYNPLPALGLTLNSSNEDIKRAAFQFIHEVGYMVIGTTSMDGVTPTSRGLELHSLDDRENLYLGVAKGKPVYFELKKQPLLTGVIIRNTVKRLSASVRISAHVTEVDPETSPEIYEKYWEINPGTKALYRKDLNMFRIFLLDKGEGEVFHLPNDDEVCRVRFGFGGEKPRPWAYEIDREKCIACGYCAGACMEAVIKQGEEGVYEIDHFGCLECGRCYMKCPNDAVICNCR